MNGVYVAFVMLVLVLAGSDANQPVKTAKRIMRQNDALKSISRSTSNFTSVLYSALSRQEGNLIFSPLSIHSILTMTSLGAKGETRKQMKEGLNLNMRDHDMKRGYALLNRRIEQLRSEKVLLKLANKIYVNKGVHLQNDFLRNSSRIFATEAEGIDFSEDDASETINQWVEGHTNNRIRDIVEKGTLDSETAMVLINAIYFKGKWQTEFEPQYTDTQPFYLTQDKYVSVPMMQVTSTYRYAEIEDSDTKVLEIPYDGENVVMMILLPNQREGLANLETDLRMNGLMKYFGSWGEGDVDLWLPKFRLEQSTQLENQLKKMGMTAMFSEGADFSAMVGEGTRTKVSDVAHKAFIEVNEEGTEAAAATMIGIQTLSLNSFNEPTLDFHADHPFIFLLYHKESMSIIFMGRFTTPE